jgi:HD-GYP domain-containing protein (c-di-GMP phosphodiesterase class II)
MPGPSAPAPRSAALVRLSRSRSAWVVALRFAGGAFRPADLRFMAVARRLLVQQRQQTQARERLQETLFDTVRGLVEALNAKNPYTRHHSERVARLAVRLGRQMQLPPEALDDLYLAGLLHDIGKIGIRSEVLQQTGPLSDADFAHLCEHPVIGDTIVAAIRPLAHLRPGVRHHHERYDGTGYPDRLAGDAIPLPARVLAVADACDAMLSPRPYRPALPARRVDEILAAGAGSQWDPGVVGHFLACRRELYALCQVGEGDSLARAVEGALHAAEEE